MLLCFLKGFSMKNVLNTLCFAILILSSLQSFAASPLSENTVQNLTIHRRPHLCFCFPLPQKNLIPNSPSFISPFFNQNSIENSPIKIQKNLQTSNIIKNSSSKDPNSSKKGKGKEAYKTEAYLNGFNYKNSIIWDILCSLAFKLGQKPMKLFFYQTKRILFALQSAGLFNTQLSRIEKQRQCALIKLMDQHQDKLIPYLKNCTLQYGDPSLQNIEELRHKACQDLPFVVIVEKNRLRSNNHYPFK